MIGWISLGNSAGSYSRSASCTITNRRRSRVGTPVISPAPFPWLLLVEDDFQVGLAAPPRVENLAGVIGAAVVDQDDLRRFPRLHSRTLRTTSANGFFFVVNRNHHR